MPSPIHFSQANLNHSLVVADTCLWLNVLGYDDSAKNEQTRKVHLECEQFISDMPLVKGLLAYTALVKPEMYNVFLRKRFGVLIGEEHPSLSKKNISEHQAEYNEACEWALAESSKAIAAINSLPYVYNEPLSMEAAELEEETFKLQHKYHLPGLCDLRHIAIAQNEGARYFATIDKDLLKVNDECITVITNQKNIDSLNQN